VSTLVKLGGFTAVLALVFGVAVAAGGTLGPEREGEQQGGGEMTGEHGTADPIRGLAVEDDGLRLELARRPGELRFTIRDARGPVKDFEVAHEKRMHLIVVRRDGTGFQHLHPTLGADGTWTTPLELSEPGAYRVFADFQRGGEAHTLAADTTVDGDARYAPFPQPSSVARVDGYEIKADGLDFTITRAGKPVTTEPYLGAGGHLVALREGDLAFLHVHPEEGEGVRFEADLEPGSRYHLYLQFKHDGAVHTAEFTR
jgi:hypothetical protein